MGPRGRSPGGVGVGIHVGVGSPAFVRAGEVYRIHSGSRVRAATHPEPDDLVPRRKHVYAAGPLAAARVLYLPGDYIRLIEAFGAVMDEVIVVPEPAQKATA